MIYILFLKTHLFARLFSCAYSDHYGFKHAACVGILCFKESKILDKSFGRCCTKNRFFIPLWSARGVFRE